MALLEQCLDQQTPLITGIDNKVFLMKYKCPCCGFMTFDEEIGASYDICPVCYWQDDSVDINANTEMISGANGMSLSEARSNFLLFGAVKEEFADIVREPLEDEVGK